MSNERHGRLTSREAGLRRDVLLGVALGALTLLAYGPVFEAGFVWDDDANVTQNLPLRSLAGLADLWLTPGVTTQYYPLTYTSFWLEYALWGLEPFGYHLDNVLLHAAAGVLLWRVLFHLAVPGAWLVAAVFVLHPVHVESVAWVTERKNVLSVVFYLAAALVYLRDVSGVVRPIEGGLPKGRFALALVLYVLALLSKPPAASLPAALLLVVWWKRGRLLASDVAKVLPMVLLAVPIGLLSVSMERGVGDHLVFDWDPTIPERVLLAGRALWFYASKLAWPVNLCFIYPRWQLDAGAAWQYVFPLAAIVVVLFCWVARGRIGRSPLVGVLYFAGTLVPALGFIEIYFFKFSFVADHWQYPASIGLIALAIGGASHAARSLGSRTRAAVAAVLLCLLAALTWQQTQIYRDIEVLWRDTLAKNPDSTLARYNLAHHLHETDRLAEAKEQYRETLHIDPAYVSASNNLGFILFQEGDVEGAIAQYRRALDYEPDDPRSHWNLGLALEKQGEVERAYDHYERSLKSEPTTRDELATQVAGHDQLGVMLARRARFADAIRHFREALRLDPGFARARVNLAKALANVGQRARAIAELEEVLAEQPGHAGAARALKRLERGGRRPNGAGRQGQESERSR